MGIESTLSFVVGFAVVATIYAVFSLGLNVHWGYTGLFNFGVAAFFSLGAYTAALVTLPKPEGVYATYVQQIIGLNQPERWRAWWRCSSAC